MEAFLQPLVRTPFSNDKQRVLLTSSREAPTVLEALAGQCYFDYPEMVEALMYHRWALAVQSVMRGSQYERGSGT